MGGREHQFGSSRRFLWLPRPAKLQTQGHRSTINPPTQFSESWGTASAHGWPSMPAQQTNGLSHSLTPESTDSVTDRHCYSQVGEPPANSPSSRPPSRRIGAMTRTCQHDSVTSGLRSSVTAGVQTLRLWNSQTLEVPYSETPRLCDFGATDSVAPSLCDSGTLELTDSVSQQPRNYIPWKSVSLSPRTGTAESRTPALTDSGTPKLPKWATLSLWDSVGRTLTVCSPGTEVAKPCHPGTVLPRTAGT